MNGLSFLSVPDNYAEIGQDFLQISGGARRLEWRLERQANGRLTAATKEKLVLSLQGFFQRKPWQPRPRVFCAIGARGVSLRQIGLPISTKENLKNLLLLQIESEFPVPPAELAWGYQALNGVDNTGNRGIGAAIDASPQHVPHRKDFLIAAVKKDAVEEYAELFSLCGASPVFTLAALARARLCPALPGVCAMLDIGRSQSELLAISDGIPASVRVLSWGSDVLARAFQEGLGVSRQEAERLCSGVEPLPGGDLGQKIHDVVDTALGSLAAALNGSPARLFLSGAPVDSLAIATKLTRQLRGGTQCEAIRSGGEQNTSAAILGLQQASQPTTGSPLPILQVKPTNEAARLPRTLAWKSAKPALALVLALLFLPYAEALVIKPFLAHKLASLKADRGRLQTIDRELGFLQYLKQNQPPYLDALFVLSKAAPQGAHFDSLTMNRSGELALRISMREPTQVVDFRSKLIESGFFSNVTIEEQAPSPDRRKLSIRLSAQVKSTGARQGLAIGPSAQEIEKAKSAKDRTQLAPPMIPGPPSSTLTSPASAVAPINSTANKGAPAAARTNSTPMTKPERTTNPRVGGGPK